MTANWYEYMRVKNSQGHYYSYGIMADQQFNINSLLDFHPALLDWRAMPSVSGHVAEITRSEVVRGCKACASAVVRVSPR